MSSNKRDSNSVPNIAGVSSVSLTGTVEPAVNPTTHAWQVELVPVTGVTQDINIVKVNGSTLSLGTTTPANSLPVTIEGIQDKFGNDITAFNLPSSDGNTASSTGLSASAYLAQFNGTTWDRVRGDTTNGLWVNLKNSVALTVTSITNALPAGTNVIGHVIVDSGSTAVTGTVATAEVAPTTISNGKTTVTTAGTRVTLASSTTVKSVTIKALIANTGSIYVGNSSVASTNGYVLAAGDSVSFDIANLNTVNIDSSVNGEGVTYIAIN